MTTSPVTEHQSVSWTR